LEYNKLINLQRLWYVNIGFSALTLLTYLSVFLSPEGYWLLGFVAYCIPFTLVLNFLWIIFWISQKKNRWWLPLSLILIGWSYLQASFSINAWFVSANNAKYKFSVLSYNVRVFNTYSYLKGRENGLSKKMIQWLAEQPAQIKCIQEFYHLQEDAIFNTIKAIALDKKYYFYVTPIEALRKKTGFFGTAIFSKFPIIRSGEVNLGTPSHQKGIYVDVKIDKDTVRIFNIHSQSMKIDEDYLFQNDESADETQDKYLDLFKRLRKGFQDRATQTDRLLEYLKKSPHPIILASDLNDLPYSYAYQSLKKLLYNSFEEAGFGFGFTRNGKLSFIRIDNQFFSSKIRIHDFKTLTNISFSDHFPLLAEYSIK